VGIQPLSLSLISLTSFQILHKKGDSVSFQKLLIPSIIELVAGHQQNCSAILEELFQGASSSSDTRPTNPYSRIYTSESSRNAKIKIREQINAEKMIVQHSERK
jgi:hypothetical protein